VARQPEARAQLFPILFLTVGLVEAMYFINLGFMIVLRVRRRQVACRCIS
jgi:F0F1-type ATP synthase membrane subunit c/vacuolar-type H+-ATPase subunit K